MTDTTPIVARDGVNVLIPHPHDIGADLVTPDDPRYPELRAQAIDMNVPEDPTADAVLLAELQARYRAGHAA